MQRLENRMFGNNEDFGVRVLNARGITIGNEKDVDFRRSIVCATRELAIYRCGVPSVPHTERKREDRRESRSTSPSRCRDKCNLLAGGLM